MSLALGEGLTADETNLTKYSEKWIRSANPFLTQLSKLNGHSLGPHLPPFSRMEQSRKRIPRVISHVSVLRRSHWLKINKMKITGGAAVSFQ
jgi:hypothetical protein